MVPSHIRLCCATVGTPRANKLLPWEAMTPLTELRDTEILFYVSWSLWPVQIHPHIQTALET